MYPYWPWRGCQTTVQIDYFLSKRPLWYLLYCDVPLEFTHVVSLVFIHMEYHTFQESFSWSSVAHILGVTCLSDYEGYMLSNSNLSVVSPMSDGDLTILFSFLKTIVLQIIRTTLPAFLYDAKHWSDEFKSYVNTTTRSFCFSTTSSSLQLIWYRNPLFLLPRCIILIFFMLNNICHSFDQLNNFDKSYCNVKHSFVLLTVPKILVSNYSSQFTISLSSPLMKIRRRMGSKTDLHSTPFQICFQDEEQPSYTSTTMDWHGSLA